MLYDDIVITSLEIENYDVPCILVDNGSLKNILFYDAFSQVNILSKQLWRVDSPLMGFSGSPVPIEGIVTLLVLVGQEWRSQIELDSLIMKIPSTYNTILGWPRLNTLCAIISTYHLLMKFLTSSGVDKIQRNQVLA